jgi:hypothetical protein
MSKNSIGVFCATKGFFINDGVWVVLGPAVDVRQSLVTGAAVMNFTPSPDKNSYVSYLMMSQIRGTLRTIYSLRKMLLNYPKAGKYRISYDRPGKLYLTNRVRKNVRKT